MSTVTLDHIESEHARIGALIQQFRQQRTATEYVIERVVIPLPAGARVAGPMFKEDGSLDYYLILHANEDNGSHSDMKTYVAERGLKLPDRREGRLLQAAFPDFCAEGTMWLDDEYEGDSAHAWYQNYNVGAQGDYRKGAAFRGVAVSRFIPSVI